jgi:hypothetical protein
MSRAPDIEHIKVKRGRCSFCGQHAEECNGEQYPEHARLHSVVEYSTQIGAFLDWMGEDGVILSREHRHLKSCYDDGNRLCGLSSDELAFDHEPIEKRLARYFDIDLNKIEAEKREMLAEIRTAHATREIRKELAL